MCLSHIYVRRKKRVAKRHEKERAAKKARADMHFSRRHKCNATTRVLTNVKPFPLSDVIVSYSLYRSARGVTDFCRPVKH